MITPDAIFKQYDIRGVVGQSLTVETSLNIGRAFGTLLKTTNPSAKTASVGRDVRLSSPELALALIKGLVSTGLDVCDLGVCPTPLQYFSLFHLDLDGGIMVTGSHNPPEYNGFKMSIGKETIHGGAIQQIERIISSEKYEVSAKEGSVKQYDIIKAYRDYVLNDFAYLAGAGYKRLKIVVDSGNGTAGLIAPDIFDQMGCEVIRLYCEPDGRFPNHHPDPTIPEYMRDLIKLTKDQKADFGVGYDGDADRIGVVDDRGNIIWGDQLMIILSRALLAEKPGVKIIGDVKCSQQMFDDIKKHNGQPIMWMTGHSLIKTKMKEESAALAGEMSGHIFFADRYFGYDDAIYTTCRLIEIVKKSGRAAVSRILADLPKMTVTPEIRIDCPDNRKAQIVAQVRDNIKYQASNNKNSDIKECITIDGIRVVFSRGWALLRSSNTQPALIMRAEAEDERCLKEYRGFMEGLIREQGVSI